jgi:hypothetical protein
MRIPRRKALKLLTVLSGALGIFVPELSMKKRLKIAFYFLGLIICIGCTTYLVFLLISSQNYRLIVGILFNLAMIIYSFRRMIKLIIEPASERQNEQEETFWTKK